MKRSRCISSDDDGGGGSIPSWAGKDTKLDTLMEKLIDSVLLMNNKLEGLSNRVNTLEGLSKRVNTLEEKVNQEITLARKERTELMDEVKSELAKLKKSQEEEDTLFLGSHLDDDSDSEGWSPWHDLDVQQRNHGNRDLNSWDKHLNVQQLNQVDNRWNLQKPVENELPVDIASCNEGWRTFTNQLDVQQPDHRNKDLNSWDRHLNVQQPNPVDSPWKSPQPERQRPVEDNLLVDNACGSESRRTSTSHLDVQQPNGLNKHLNGRQPNEELCSEDWRTWTSHLDGWDTHLHVQQPNGWGCQSNVQQPGDWDKYSNVQQPGDWDKYLNVQQPGDWDTYLNVQQPGDWDKYLNVQQPNGVDRQWNLQQPNWKKPVDNELPVASHLNVQQPGAWDKYLNVQQPNSYPNVLDYDWSTDLTWDSD